MVRKNDSVYLREACFPSTYCETHMQSGPAVLFYTVCAQMLDLTTMFVIHDREWFAKLVSPESHQAHFAGSVFSQKSPEDDRYTQAVDGQSF